MRDDQESRSSCRRCQTEPHTLILRTEAVCNNCFARFISTKVVKRLEALQRHLRVSPTSTAKYLLGLSFGTSSVALLQVLSEIFRQRAEKRRKPPFELLVVHVDTGSAVHGTSKPGTVTRILEKYREKYPEFDLRCLALSSALTLQTVDWSALPTTRADCAPGDQLRGLLENLPSATARSDAVRLLTRHVLLSVARQNSCLTTLLGSSTTALAELTLSETAKGRGFGLPWQVEDGDVHPQNSSAGGTPEELQSLPREAGITIYYPLRDVFRKELVTYSSLIDPPLADLILDHDEKAGTAVSHKEMSIEQVVARYFEEVEENYPSVVANVVRTVGKLRRQKAETACGLCGLGLDGVGDERWQGELGDEGGGSTESGRLCYGCQRSIST